MSRTYRDSGTSADADHAAAFALPAHDNPQDSTSLLLDLPNELLLEIAKQLEGDNVSLAALVRTCRQLKPITEEPLYRTIADPPYATEGAAYIVRTIFHQPQRATKIINLNITLSNDLEVNEVPMPSFLGTASLCDGSEWAAHMQVHLESLQPRMYERWIRGIQTGRLINISAVLLTLLSKVGDLQLFTYDNVAEEYPDDQPIKSIFKMDFDNFCKYLRPVLRRCLGCVEHFSILGGSLDLFHLAPPSLESLDPDLTAQLPGPSGYIAYADRSLLSPPHPPKPRTLILNIDWSELRDEDMASIGLQATLTGLNITRLQNLEMYIARTQR